MCKTSECVWNMESIVRGVMCETSQCVWSME